MKTGDLIDLLARDAGPMPAGAAWRRLGAALIVGGAVALLAVLLWLKCQPLLLAAAQPWFWMKAAYTALLSVGGALMVRRLATPGAPLGPAPGLALLTVGVMIALGAGQLAGADAADRLAIWLGGSWKVCSSYILLLAVPVYVALAVALRALAPTRPARAGAAAGFTAGAVAATAYGLHCPEQGAAFVVTWYSLGIAAATALGALVGHRLLRW